MSDQKKWFKVWTSVLTDPHLSNLDNSMFAQWVKLGAFMAQHGDKGTIKLNPPATSLCATLQVQNWDHLMRVFDALPNVMRRCENDYGTMFVTLKNWNKYQIDNTASERMKTLRSKRRGEENRGEENRKEPPLSEIPPTNPSVKIFIDHIFQRVLSETGKKLMVDGKKDGAIVKKLLSTYGLDELKRLWDVFMRSTDPFIRKTGFSIGIFKTQINKLLTGKSEEPTGMEAIRALRREEGRENDDV